MLARVRIWFGRLRACNRGISAVEFSLLSPILMLGALATFDAGAAIYEKMSINQALRAAAQSAIATQDVNAVRNILISSAEANFSVISGNAGDQDTLAVDVIRYCVCPNATGTVVACTTICTSLQPVYELYELSATKTYTGILLPAMTLDGTLDVLVP